MKQVGIKYGVIVGMFYIIVTTLDFMFGLSTGGIFHAIGLSILNFLITFAIVYVAVKELRDDVNSMTTGVGLKLGITIGLIAGVIASVFTLIYTGWIDPDAMARQMEASAQILEDFGMSEEDIETALERQSEKKSAVRTVGTTILWLALWGLLKGVISGAILKQDPPV